MSIPKTLGLGFITSNASTVSILCHISVYLSPVLIVPRPGAKLI